MGVVNDDRFVTASFISLKIIGHLDSCMLGEQVENERGT